MQIVINISKESYKNIKEQVEKRDYPDMQIGRAIADGVLIPECHGKLVDIDLLCDQVSHDEREAFSKHQVNTKPHYKRGQRKREEMGKNDKTFLK